MNEVEQYQLNASSAAELVREIEFAVASGGLLPGQRLPSVRQLAGQVGLSPATVAAGLAELRRRGVVLSEPRRGTRIGQAPPIGTVMSSVPVPQGARDLSQGNPDPALLPDLKAALSCLELPPRLYGEPSAVNELLEFARSQLSADLIAADHLCIVSGALDGIERVLAVHLRPGDRVAVENPGYAALFHLLRARGLGLEPVALDEYGMLPEALESTLKRGARAVVITPRGQNPTGAALDPQRAEQLREILARYPSTLVIEDDHLGDLAGARLHSVVGQTENWAAARSVAKALGPDLRLAILAGDRETIDRVEGLQVCGPGWVSHILQRLVLALYSDQTVAALITQARDTYTQRRESLIESLALHGITVSARSGLNVWVNVQEEASVIAAMLARGWALAPGVPYRLNPSSPAVRVTISTLSAVEAERLASDLASTASPTRSQRSG